MLFLWSNELVENSDTFAPGNRKVARVVGPPLDAYPITRSTEKRPDVRGGVGEVVAGIRLAVHPIEDPAPVRVQKTTEERCREAIDDVLLPIHQPDEPL